METKNKYEGLRKVFLALCIIGVAAVIPINPNQADVLKAVAYAVMGANMGEHLGKAIHAACTRRAGNGSSSSDAVSGDSKA